MWFFSHQLLKQTLRFCIMQRKRWLLQWFVLKCIRLCKEFVRLEFHVSGKGNQSSGKIKWIGFQHVMRIMGLLDVSEKRHLSIFLLHLVSPSTLSIYPSAVSFNKWPRCSPITTTAAHINKCKHITNWVEFMLQRSSLL